MIAAIDTNVLVSGMINPGGPPGRIVDLLRSGVLIPAVDDRILAEYGDVLRRPHLAQYFTPSEIDTILEYLLHNSEHFLVTRQVTDLPDHGDAPFLEVAIAAESPLVTGNVKDVPPQKSRGVTIELPGAFIRRFEGEDRPE